MENQNQKNFFQTKTFSRILFVLGGLIVAGLIFQAGIFVGYYKASFSYRLGDEYHNMFGQRERGFQGVMMPGFSGAYGAAGDILKIELPVIVIEDQDSIEKNIIISTSTIFRKMRDTISASDLKVDDFVTVIGEPNENGQIVAKLVRVSPPPPGWNEASDTSAQSKAEVDIFAPKKPNKQ